MGVSMALPETAICLGDQDGKAFRKTFDVCNSEKVSFRYRFQRNDRFIGDTRWDDDLSSRPQSICQMITGSDGTIIDKSQRSDRFERLRQFHA